MLQELGVEEVGIEASDGFIDVDCHMRTNIPGVYAIGDLTGKAQLASAASAQGKVAADDIAGIPNRIRYELIPYCIFSEPEVAWVGLSREQAEERGYNVKTGSFHTAGNGKCMVVGDSVGFSKIVTDTQTGEILGAQIMAPNATEIISSVIAAMSAESTVEELATSVFAHPTISEIVMESAQDCMGLCCNK